MLESVAYGMIFIGSALMLCNIICFTGFARRYGERMRGGGSVNVLYFPIALLVLFLLGYLAVIFFGDPDLIVAGVLFGGSVFVYLVYLLLERVTRRILEHEHLEAQLMAAHESDRAKTRFLSSMSHEMRTPMNAIIGLDEIALRSPDLPAETRDQLEKIGVSAHHLLELINNVLDLSHIESGHLELRPAPFALEELLKQVNTVVRTRCEEKGLTYVCQVGEGLDARYEGDALRLRQVLNSLLDNAVKFTPAPGEVRLTVERAEALEDARRLRFIVRDTGVGMDPAFLPRVFDMFSQEDSTDTTRYGGSGVGLALVKSFAEAMGGDVRVQSEKDRGSVFTVEVNLVPCKAPDAPPAEAGETAPALAGRRVLIAEDMEINAEILADLLDMEGVDSDRAGNGQEAVDRFSRTPPGHYDAILMDLRMPVMDGLDATRTIRALKRRDAGAVPIIALSANAFEDDVNHSLEAGMNAHLSKPVDPDLLYKTLIRLIKQDEGAVLV